jgi:succinate-semialdehyde dehydrogenase/glutarate-semialdehyde dehydrogenase
MSIASINPATQEILKHFQTHSDSEIESKMSAAARAFTRHRKTSFADRSGWMIRAAEILERDVEKLARIMTLEMGKTLDSARAEALKCATACRYYAEHAEALLADEDVKTSATRSYIHYQPIGVVLAVMPWNFPFWQVFRFAVPALMAGNVGLLKHASNVPQCALAIEGIFQQAGFAEGVFQSLLIGADKVQRVLDDPRIAAATLTGSEPAGRQVARQAGFNIKKTVLELGGSDPFIVMPTANIYEAATVAVQARVINNGQSCIAAKRFFVHEKIATEFQELFVQGMNSLRIGDPMLAATQLGPLSTPAMVTDLERQIEQLTAAGAKILTGGKRIEGKGNYFQPTVITDIKPGTPAYYEELFGPAAMFFVVQDAQEAARIANDSQFGLGASVWTNDPKERDYFIDEIESGMVFVNAMTASDPRLPFGGVKHSGYGRELGIYGIREFVNIKTVYIKDEGAEQ